MLGLPAYLWLGRRDVVAIRFLDTREWQSKLQAFAASVISVPGECIIIFGNERL